MWNLEEHLKSEFSVSDTEWQMILSYLEEIDFPKNSFFIRHGKVSRRSGFILEGIMRYFDTDEKGKEPTCYFSFAGHYIVDPFAYYEQKPSAINLKSISDCRLAVISYDDEKKLIAKFPRWKEITTSMLLKVSTEFANQKTMMSLSAAKRYRYFNDQYPQLAVSVPLQFIASYLGIAQPSLSRLRKELARGK
jgi:CRP-like cAMP-binding protein